ncbi:uncharacterized protein LOC100377828 [Saccoglossus kowalevskii]|uniref:Uncharacterized protein LOC100377828 isoform X1 n=1 Tax=Saccoglossus kowalevskii TaxID=10224 RepID=A0ABM0GRD6_SACKO|nr:PREDICTED: uncharacterized protein LOC100377828 isoform X1 [Saccoglossus kowalevskii]
MEARTVILHVVLGVFTTVISNLITSVVSQDYCHGGSKKELNCSCGPPPDFTLSFPETGPETGQTLNVSSECNAGCIAGCVIGCLFLIFLIIALLYYFKRKRKLCWKITEDNKSKRFRIIKPRRSSVSPSPPAAERMEAAELGHDNPTMNGDSPAHDPYPIFQKPLALEPLSDPKNKYAENPSDTSPEKSPRRRKKKKKKKKHKSTTGVDSGDASNRRTEVTTHRELPSLPPVNNPTTLEGLNRPLRLQPVQSKSQYA